MDWVSLVISRLRIEPCVAVRVAARTFWSVLRRNSLPQDDDGRMAVAGARSPA
jgi:hypothetical protein